jgi:hypothetical protein
VAGSVQSHRFSLIPILLKEIVDGTIQFAARRSGPDLLEGDTAGLFHRLECEQYTQLLAFLTTEGLLTVYLRNKAD